MVSTVILSKAFDFGNISFVIKKLEFTTQLNTQSC